MDVIIASNNKGKIKEFKKLFSSLDINVLSLSDINLNIEIEETGKTFLENALIKAKTIYEITSMPVIADDSGLEVYALDNKPGIYSARFFKDGASDEENNHFLLKQLENVEDRRARFVCVIVFYCYKKMQFYCEGICEGEISKTFHGDNGFGYDPLFLVNKKSYAQMDINEKNEISHRGKAFKILKNKMVEFLKLYD